MAVNRTYQCSECSGQFTVQQEWNEGAPRFCQHCGFDFDLLEERPAAELPRVNIGGSALSKSVDQTYRQLEDGPAKLTDLKDGLRPGDVAARPVNNIVTQTMQSIAESGGPAGPWQGNNVQGYLTGQPKKGRGASNLLGALQGNTPAKPLGPTLRAKD